MAGESLKDAEVTWHGLAGDRRWAFLRTDTPRSGFPWHTIRENHTMLRYRPTFMDPSRPDTSDIIVRTPTGEGLDVLDPDLSAELGEGLRAVKQDRGIFDSSPVSLITTGTVAAVDGGVKPVVDVRRFRPNLLINPADDRPFEEDGWVGAILQIGEFRIRVDRRDPRCAIINIDPETSVSDRSVLRMAARQRQNRLGVYGSIVQPGHVSVGDPVLLTSSTEQ